jgi:hypothetical protein
LSDRRGNFGKSVWVSAPFLSRFGVRILIPAEFLLVEENVFIFQLSTIPNPAPLPHTPTFLSMLLMAGLFQRSHDREAAMVLRGAAGK